MVFIYIAKYFFKYFSTVTSHFVHFYNKVICVKFDNVNTPPSRAALHLKFNGFSNLIQKQLYLI